MTSQLIRARKRPNFGFPWLAMFLGAGTLAFAGVGFNAVTEQPSAPVEIIIDGEHPLNISRATVEAVTEEPILAWKPLKVMVTDRLLSYDELQGRVDPGADVIISTAIVDEASNSGREERFSGAGIFPAATDRGQNTANRYDIHNAYMDNVGLGHGPAAVAAAAQRAAEVLDDGRIRTPEFWVAGTAFGLLLTVLAFAYALPRRGRREALYRRLIAAQRQLAGVVLDLEALEVTFLATELAERPPAFTNMWKQIRESSLAMARSEETVIAAVYNPRISLKPRTAALVAQFEAKSRRLAASADALMGAGAVLGGQSQSERTFDRLAAPMAFGTRELLARLHQAPAGLVPPRRVERLEEALTRLLVAGSKNQKSAPAVNAWKKAEQELERCAISIRRTLRRHLKGPAGAQQRAREDLSSLRVGVGLPANGAQKVLDALDGANDTARALFGPLSRSVEEHQEPAAPRRRRAVRIPRLKRRTAWVVSGLLVALPSLIAGGLVAESATAQPEWTLRGSQSLRSLALDGDTRGITEAGIRKYLDDKFTEPVDVTVAVRDAEDYLKVASARGADGEITTPELDPTVLVDALWRIKGELPELTDQTTGELLSGNAVIPVWVFDDSTATSPTPITAAVARGDISRLGDSTWEYGSIYVSSYRESAVATEIERLSRGLQGNGYFKPDVNGTLLFWLLTSAFALALVTLGQLFSFGRSMMLRLGSFGRNASRARRVRQDLEALALDLDDSRLNTVAVLGAGPAASSAEADQRIFERALAMAWRMAEELGTSPWSQRHGAAYVAQIEKLEGLVARLGIRDADAARRTRELLDAALTDRVAVQ